MICSILLSALTHSYGHLSEAHRNAEGPDSIHMSIWFPRPSECTPDRLCPSPGARENTITPARATTKDFSMDCPPWKTIRTSISRSMTVWTVLSAIWLVGHHWKPLFDVRRKITRPVIPRTRAVRNNSSADTPHRMPPISPPGTIVRLRIV